MSFCCAIGLSANRSKFDMLLRSGRRCFLGLPWAYLKDVLTKLPTWPNSRLDELLLYRPRLSGHGFATQAAFCMA